MLLVALLISHDLPLSHDLPRLQVALQAVLLLALLIVVHEELGRILVVHAAWLTGSLGTDLFGFESVFPLAVIIFGFNASALAAALVVVVATYRRARVRLLRCKWTHDPLSLAPLADGHYHVFLSHAWITGQDPMRVVKQRLGEMLPGVAVFLDVDDLQRKVGKAAELLAISSCSPMISHETPRSPSISHALP